MKKKSFRFYGEKIFESYASDFKSILKLLCIPILINIILYEFLKKSMGVSMFDIANTRNLFITTFIYLLTSCPMEIALYKMATTNYKSKFIDVFAYINKPALYMISIRFSMAALPAAILFVISTIAKIENRPTLSLFLTLTTAIVPFIITLYFIFLYPQIALRRKIRISESKGIKFKAMAFLLMWGTCKGLLTNEIYSTGLLLQNKSFLHIVSYDIALIAIPTLLYSVLIYTIGTLYKYHVLQYND